ncbi:hypothetical protein L2E82_03623 [Cichorium intybus]|uniref:Uncharacterized protein n=1 Tax=Cichorium intybus TaxID=13427 RepID=A0ACB9H3U9_CICIN|nr:hypothetical protein L2E82_03623 [Cichorium intybus]
MEAAVIAASSKQETVNDCLLEKGCTNNRRSSRITPSLHDSIVLLRSRYVIISQMVLMPMLARVISEEKILSIGLIFICIYIFLYSVAWSSWVVYVAGMCHMLAVFAGPSSRSIGKAQGFITCLCSFASIISPLIFSPLTELGAHTLVCTAQYSDGDADRKYLPQYFKFIVSNPLSVRTKEPFPSEVNGKPIASILGVPSENIYANNLLFNNLDEFAGFDENEPTSRSGGKPTAVELIRKTHRYKIVVMIGDGATDLEARKHGCVDLFICYGGVQLRDSVPSKADWLVFNFKDLINSLE